MITSAPLVDELQAFATLLVPELPSPAIVLASRDEIEAEIPTPGEWAGVCCRDSLLTAEFRQRYGLGKSGALIFVDARVCDTPVALHTTIVHERAHEAKTTTPPVAFTPLPTAGERRRAARELFGSNEYLAAPRWIGDHGIGFIRRALHLATRAVMAGHTIELRDLCAGPNYDLSTPFAYLEALGDEPERMANWTMASIELTTPPADFLDIWEADQAAYFSTQELNNATT